MPAKSVKQQKLFGAALARKRKGEESPDDPKMSEKKLKEFASTKHKGLPEKVKPKAKKAEKKPAKKGKK